MPLNLPTAGGGGFWGASHWPPQGSLGLGSALARHPGSWPPLGAPAPMGAVQAPLARPTLSRCGAGEPAPSRVGRSAGRARTPHAGAVPHPAKLAWPGPRRAGGSRHRCRIRTGPGARGRGPPRWRLASGPLAAADRDPSALCREFRKGRSGPVWRSGNGHARCAAIAPSTTTPRSARPQRPRARSARRPSHAGSPRAFKPEQPATRSPGLLMEA